MWFVVQGLVNFSSDLIRESQNLLSWEGSIRIIKSNSEVSGAYTAQAQTHHCDIITTMLLPTGLLYLKGIVLFEEKYMGIYHQEKCTIINIINIQHVKEF